MIKRFVACSAFILFMLFVVFTLVSNAWPADKTFTLTINASQVTVKLPGEFSIMEIAEFKWEECFNLVVCRQRFFLAETWGDVDFIYNDKAEVLALVWINRSENVYVAWKYVDGLPVLVGIKDINQLIRDAEKPGTVNFRGKLQLGPKPPPIFIDFTYEGELNPDIFAKWKVIKTKFDSSGIIWMYWQNPDPNSPIKVVVGEVYIDETLLAYRYFKNGQPYMFTLDSEQNKYVRYNFTDVEKKDCMRCHESEVELPKVLKEV